MKYTYYPGCSLHGACGPYDTSLKRVMTLLGHELEVALSVSARNLALAEKSGTTLMAPCSACYTTLMKTNRYLREVPRMREQVQGALAEADMSYNMTVKVRHPLDIIVNDIGVDSVVRRAKRKLDGLKVAPYYGCQIVRPEPGFDDRDWPTSMDQLFSALGAEMVYYPDRVRCCGGMLITTYPDVGKELTGDLLETARRNGADVIVTTCPLCQVNLEGYQDKVKTGNGKNEIPVLFFTQLLGLALGDNGKDLDLHRSMVPLGERLSALAGV
jgi:heterodisulfide reductase subunit B